MELLNFVHEYRLELTFNRRQKKNAIFLGNFEKFQNSKKIVIITYKRKKWQKSANNSRGVKLGS